MGIPLHFGRWKSKHSLILLTILPLAILCVGMILPLDGNAWGWTQVVVAGLILILGRGVLGNGLVSLFFSSRVSQDTIVSLVAAAGFCFGFLFRALDSAGFVASELQGYGPLAQPFLCVSAMVVAVRLVSRELGIGQASRGPAGIALPMVNLHPILRPTLFCAFLLGLALTIPQALPVGGIPGAVALGIALLAAFSPETYYLSKEVVQRFTEKNLPGGPAELQLERVAEIETVLIEKSKVLTTGKCELREVVLLDSGVSEEDVLHFAAIAEVLLPPNPIRNAILDRARNSLRTVPTLKGYSHTSGRGVSARYRNLKLLFGNLEWLKEQGHSAEEMRDLKEQIRNHYERGETVLFVSLGGTVMGAIGLYDPPRPEIEGFVRDLKELGVQVYVLTGDSPDTVKGLLADQPGVEFIAGLRPQQLTERLRELNDVSTSVALIAKKDSSLSASARPFIGALFELNRKNRFTASTNPKAAPLDLQSGSLDRISHLLRLARKTIRAERNRVYFLAAYHLALLPAILSAAIYFIPWKYYGVLGILLGALLPTLVVPSERSLEGALAGPAECSPPASDDRKVDTTDRSAAEAHARAT